jgi:hypothetical protein
MTYTVALAKRYRDHEANLGMSATDFTLSDDNCLIFCDGVIVDAISLLGGTNSEVGRSLPV